VHSSDPELAKKFVLFNPTTAVAFVGLSEWDSVAPNGKVLYYFDALKFLNGIKHSLPPNASVSTVEGVVVDKLKIAMNRIAPYFANDPVESQNAAFGKYISFIIVGYSAKVPVIHIVGVEIDWNLRKISNPITQPIDPSPNSPRPLCVGINTAYRRLFVRNSAEHVAAASRYPAALSPVNSTSASAFASDVIRLQSEFDPEDVGPPIHVLTLMRDKGPLEETLPK
jgi:hypothetical protein